VVGNIGQFLVVPSAIPLACIIHEDFGKSSKALARSSSSDLAEKQSVF
jgi:hypothetical protein